MKTLFTDFNSSSYDGHLRYARYKGDDVLSAGTKVWLDDCDTVRVQGEIVGLRPSGLYDVKVIDGTWQHREDSTVAWGEQ
jgi:hypothetical protein